jgi:hypothetical protein
MHTYNPITEEVEARDHVFEASMGYVGRPYLKNKSKKDSGTK